MLVVFVDVIVGKVGYLLKLVIIFGFYVFMMVWVLVRLWVSLILVLSSFSGFLVKGLVVWILFMVMAGKFLVCFMLCVLVMRWIC